MQKYNVEKFINATLFFAEKVSDLGITKLNKLLYYSDFEHYRLYGRSILGDDYMKMERGPVPRSSYNLFNANFKDDIDSSLKQAIEVKPKIVIDFWRKCIHAKQKPDLSIFSESEIKVLEDIALNFKESLGTTLSRKSHDEKPWKETQENEIIDYKLGLDQPDSISVDYATYHEEQDKLLEKMLANP